VVIVGLAGGTARAGLETVTLEGPGAINPGQQATYDVTFEGKLDYKGDVKIYWLVRDEDGDNDDQLLGQKDFIMSGDENEEFSTKKQFKLQCECPKGWISGLEPFCTSHEFEAEVFVEGRWKTSLGPLTKSNELKVRCTPELGTWVLLACTGAVGAALRRRRKK